MEPQQPWTMESSWSAELIGPLEEQPWLDQVADYVMELAKPLLELPQAERVMDFLHGRWLGHALHPVLTDIPIGMWSGSLLLDLVGAHKSAGVLSATGSAGAVGAVASGFADWSDSYGRDRRLGILHGLLNTGGLGLHLLSLSARLRRRKKSAMALSALGLSVSTVAAYLGGELVFGRGWMVNHDAWITGPEKWTAVAAEGELTEGSTSRAEVEGRGIVLYKESGRVLAIEGTCSHAGGPLWEGKVRDGVVTCPWHGSQFRLADGAVCRGPATFSQPRLQTRIRGGQVEVRGRQG
jgi:nitrite reductase/ring-hydroxylating ferredoxin subunit